MLWLFPSPRSWSPAGRHICLCLPSLRVWQGSVRQAGCGREKANSHRRKTANCDSKSGNVRARETAGWFGRMPRLCRVTAITFHPVGSPSLQGTSALRHFPSRSLSSSVNCSLRSVLERRRRKLGNADFLTGADGHECCLGMQKASASIRGAMGYPARSHPAKRFLNLLHPLGRSDRPITAWSSAWSGGCSWRWLLLCCSAGRLKRHHLK